MLYRPEMFINQHLVEQLKMIVYSTLLPSLLHTTSQWLPTSIILLLAVHVFCMDCALFITMACRLLLCTLCSSLLHWPRLHMLLQLGGDSLTNAADRNRLEAFIRRAVRHGYCAHTTPTLSLLCDKADKRLFDSIITNSTHPLRILLPPKVRKHYFTRPRSHCYELPRKTSALDENNFFYRLLYCDILSVNSADWHFYLSCCNSGLSVFH